MQISIFLDPHFQTLDGLTYSFNGFGEYVLLKIDELKFNSQVRMMPYIKKGKVTQGTVMKAIAIKGENMDTIQIEINQSKDLNIYINEQEVKNFNFHEKVTLMGLEIEYSSETFILQYFCGIRFQIKSNKEHDALAIMTSVSERFNHETRGLLGKMDHDTSNDFTLPDDTVLKINPQNDKEIFYKFGEQWRTESYHSVFKYFNGLTHSSYVNKKHNPQFMSDGIVFEDKSLELLAKKICGENKYCLFDISVTGETSIGSMDIEISNEAKKQKNLFKKSSQICPPLSNNFDNGFISRSTIENGFEYHFSCYDNFCLIGGKKIKCVHKKYDFAKPVCVRCSKLESLLRK
jgi:hypothetical protein